MSSVDVSWQQKAAARRRNSGNRTLHASGVSILAMADIAYRKTLEFDGPLGSTWRRIVKLAEPVNPIIDAIQYQWLAILAFFDDQLLVVQKIIETLFPPSSHLFGKSDDLVLAIMSLPENFDDALNKLPEIIHQVPFLECVLLYLISWLNCLVSIFNYCGLDNSRIKEITVDKNTICSEKSEAPNCSTDNSERNDNGESDKGRLIPASESEPSEAASKRVAMTFPIPKRGSYKEALVRHEGENVNASVHLKDEAGRSGRTKEEDQILGLFESGWTL